VDLYRWIKKIGMVGYLLACQFLLKALRELIIDFPVKIAKLLFLKFWQQSTLHAHQNQSVHDDVDMPLPTLAF